MEKENHLDIIICGGGASGLLLANGLIKDPAFDQLNILLLEKDKKTLNDRTWCFWKKTKENGKAWYTTAGTMHCSMHPTSATVSHAAYQYKMIRGLDFYQAIYPRLEKAPNVKIVQAEITDIDPRDEYCLVKTENTTYRGNKVFSVFRKTTLPNSKNTPFFNSTLLAGLFKPSNPFLTHLPWCSWILICRKEEARFIMSSLFRKRGLDRIHLVF